MLTHHIITKSNFTFYILVLSTIFTLNVSSMNFIKPGITIGTSFGILYQNKDTIISTIVPAIKKAPDIVYDFMLKNPDSTVMPTTLLGTGLLINYTFYLLEKNGINSPNTKIKKKNL